MKKSIFSLTLLIVTVLFMSGCGQDELTVTLVQHGNLTIKTLNDGKVVPEAKLRLNRNFSTSGELLYKESDANGMVDFGALNQGTYTVSVEATVGELKYNINQSVQVISGISKNYDFELNDYTGAIQVQFNDIDGNPSDTSGLKVAVLYQEDFQFEQSLEEQLEAAVFTGVSDSNGQVNFERVPVGTYAVIYYGGEETINISTFIGVQRRGTWFINLRENS